MTSRAPHSRYRYALPAACLCLMAGILAGTMSPSWAGGAVGLCLCLPALLLLRGKWRAAALLALTLCAGSLLGWHAEHPALPEEGMHLVTGIIADEVLPGNRTQYRTTLRHLTIDGAPYAQGGYWTFYTDELPQGLEWLRRSADPQFPFGSNWRLGMKDSGKQ